MHKTSIITSLPITPNQPSRQIDIVAHSLGGLITREMLRLRKADLYSHGIMIGRVTTLGTPHKGEPWLFCEAVRLFSSLGGNPSTSNTFRLKEGVEEYEVEIRIADDNDWNTPILDQVQENSNFMNNLNANPLDYSDKLQWFTIAGDITNNDNIDGSYFRIKDGVENYGDDYGWDSLVPVSSANGLARLITSINVQQVILAGVEHSKLINDPTYHRSYSYIENWLAGTIDSDNDGLSDAEELFVYHTSPYDTNSDTDALTDGTKVAWGYDPTDASNPIPQSALLASVVKNPSNPSQLTFLLPSCTDYQIVVKAYDSQGHYIGQDKYN